MQSCTLIKISLSACLLCAFVHANGQGFPPLNANDPKGLLLPAGIPKFFDTNGNLIGFPYDFHPTRQPRYRRAAIELMVQEANRVAQHLNLAEKLPITVTNLTDAWLEPFIGYYRGHAIGTISTKNYNYFFCQGDKFNEVDIVSSYRAHLNLEGQKLPVSQFDPKGAYQLATEWLAAVAIDVGKLNRDCRHHVRLISSWGVSLGKRPRKPFVPIYDVWWATPKQDAENYGDVVDVQLIRPGNKLLSIQVLDPQYIVGKPLIITNLAAFFPGTAPTAIITNIPADTNVYFPIIRG